MKKLTHLLSVFFIVMALLSASIITAAADGGESLSVSAYSEVNNTFITKYGNFYLYVSKEDFLDAGFNYGDIVSVTVGTLSFDVPFCSEYSDVDYGKTGLFARSKDQYINLATNSGNFAEENNIAVKKNNEDGTYEWKPLEGYEGQIEAVITLKEAGGYLDELSFRHLTYSNDRNDYMDLSDAEFANFREINTNGITDGILYRSSSPLSPYTGRADYAAALTEAAGVKTIINLAESAKDAEAYESFAGSYYSQCAYIAVNMPAEYTSDEFRGKLAQALEFMAENEGPYLIHCSEGKDRAGNVSALLELFMGADKDSVIGDYAVSFTNYYGVTEGTSIYNYIVQSFESSFTDMLSAGIGESFDGALTQANAEEYIRSLGLSDEQIQKLKENLGYEKESESGEPVESTSQAEPASEPEDNSSANSSNKSEGSSKAKENGTNESVNTGDVSDIYMYVLILAAAFAGIAVPAVLIKKH